MGYFIVIENDEGLLVIGVDEGQTAEAAALARGGEVVDAGPYRRYDDAYDAMLLIPEQLDDLHRT